MPRKSASARERFAASVLSIRNRKGLSGDAVAAAAGISRNTLYLIENRAANAQIDTLCRLAIALDVDPCDFFSIEPHRPRGHNQILSLRRTIVGNIRAQRLTLALSQSELTRRLDMPRNYIGHIERNAPDLSLDVLERIAKELRLPIEKVFEEPKPG
jgi:transcriptional regulator with XRE-family HTH domain